MKIPFSPPYITDGVVEEVTAALRSGWITSGPRVRQLEEALAVSYQIPAVVACNSGTSAMELALRWFGIGKGDEVIIPAYTYAATALAVMHTGATPVMVDSGDDFNIDPDKIAAALTSKTKAIVPVDIGGWPADYNRIRAALDSHPFHPASQEQQLLGRPLILADTAHSLGAIYQGQKSGRLADVSAFSFHAVKNITTAEGGALAINLPAQFDNQQVARDLKLRTLNGQTKDAFTKSRAGGWQYDIIFPGYKMNLPDVLAAIGLAQFRIYETDILPARKEIFKKYNSSFEDVSRLIVPLLTDDNKESSAHLYLLRLHDVGEQQRNEVISHIESMGVAVNVHFIPLPMLTVFREAGYDINKYPRAYEHYSKEITLPLYPQLTSGQIDYIVDAVKSSLVTCL